MEFKVAVNQDGSEWVISGNPVKKDGYWDTLLIKVPLRNGTIERVLGRKMAWGDEPQPASIAKLFFQKEQA